MQHIFKVPLVFSLFMLLLLPSRSSAQAEMTSHFMDGLAQANHENPAMLPDVKFHFSFPALSSVYVEAANSGFHFQDVIENRGDSSYLMLDQLINEKLNGNNHIAVHYGHELLSFGLNLDDQMYFSFAVTERVNLRFTYPQELLGLPYNGNAAYIGETVELSPLSIKATHYREYAMGAAWQEPGHWSGGIRFKLLFAKANAWTEEAYASLLTEEQGYGLTAEAELLGHMTLPGSMDPENLDNTSDIDVEQYLMNTANWGVGLDLGFNYIFNDQFSASASVIDLGSVNFNGNTYTYKNERAKVTFEGFDAYDYANMSDSLMEEELQNTLDSITDKFNITDNEKSYKMPLTTRFYVGGQYHLSDHQEVGLLFRGQFFDGAFWPALTASYGHEFGRVLSLTASYTATHDSYFNLGLGAAVNAGPIQFYMVSDNWTAALRPERTKYLNLHFGLNVAIRQKPSKGKPMFIVD